MNFIQIAAILGALAVILGAFGAHTLKGQLTEVQLATYQTGVLYHFIHVFAMLVVGILFKQTIGNTTQLYYAGWFFLIGIAFFSGSLYLLSCKSILGIEGWKFLGPITPLGGTLFIVGWVLLGVSQR